jgi:hypothetical protein
LLTPPFGRTRAARATAGWIAIARGTSQSGSRASPWFPDRSNRHLHDPDLIPVFAVHAVKPDTPRRMGTRIIEQANNLISDTWASTLMPDVMLQVAAAADAQKFRAWQGRDASKRNTAFFTFIHRAREREERSCLTDFACGCSPSFGFGFNFTRTSTHKVRKSGV